jgi:hypothetical protein
MPYNFLIVDATEGSEVGIYLVDGNDAPNHLKRHIKRTGQTAFDDLIEDGAEGLQGLVDEDSEQADERADEVWEWLRSKTTRENRFTPTGGRVPITHTISIASA